MELRTAAYDHPDALRLTETVQREYERRYGSGDEAPIDAGQFLPPHGLFLLGYLDDTPVAMGGWRMLDGAHTGSVEIKRMYVAPSARGRGLSRVMLAELERRAADAGADRVILETGDRQPEAISLYTSAGYTPIAPFGYYAGHPLSRHFGKGLRVRNRCE